MAIYLTYEILLLLIWLLCLPYVRFVRFENARISQGHTQIVEGFLCGINSLHLGTKQQSLVVPKTPLTLLKCIVSRRVPSYFREKHPQTLSKQFSCCFPIKFPEIAFLTFRNTTLTCPAAYHIQVIIYFSSRPFYRRFENRKRCAESRF